jgi:hypothetical protein
LPGADWLDVWPALLAARSTWLMKLFGFGARVLRMRPGRTRKSLSPSLIVGLWRAILRTVPEIPLKSLVKSLGAARPRPTGTRKAMRKQWLAKA